MDLFLHSCCSIHHLVHLGHDVFFLFSLTPSSSPIGAAASVESAVTRPTGHRGFDEFFNARLRLSFALMGDKDPRLVRDGKGKSAPYVHKPKGIIRVCCSNWNQPGGCTVRFLFMHWYLYLRRCILVCGY